MIIYPIRRRYIPRRREKHCALRTQSWITQEQSQVPFLHLQFNVVESQPWENCKLHFGSCFIAIIRESKASQFEVRWRKVFSDVITNFRMLVYLQSHKCDCKRTTIGNWSILKWYSVRVQAQGICINRNISACLLIFVITLDIYFVKFTCGSSSLTLQ